MRYLLKRLVVKVKKSDISGWQKVFGFTFVQHYKSKAAIIALVITCLLVIASGPVITMLKSSGVTDKLDLSDTKIEEIFIVNNTDYSISADKFKYLNPLYSKVNVVNSNETIEVVIEKIKNEKLQTALAVNIYTDSDHYNIDIYRSAESKITTIDTGLFSDAVESYFYNVRMEQSGVSFKARNLINASINTNIVNESNISKEKDGDVNQILSTVTIIYGCIIMFIVLLSSQQISTSIIIEKSSKVIETLLMSARPLAIVVGKITGMMVVMLCDFVLIIICAIFSLLLTVSTNDINVSDLKTKLIATVNAVSAGANPSEFTITSMTELNIGLGRIIIGIVIIILTTLLAYLFYSVIAGIAGASCKSMEDLTGASSFISILTILGMYMSMALSFVNNKTYTSIIYLFPFSGIYTVPIHFIFGKAAFSDILILWAELIILSVLLFKFAANIYHVLVFHNGERLKIKNLINISKSQKGQDK